MAVGRGCPCPQRPQPKKPMVAAGHISLVLGTPGASLSRLSEDRVPLCCKMRLTSPRQLLKSQTLLLGLRVRGSSRAP